MKSSAKSGNTKQPSSKRGTSTNRESSARDGEYDNVSPLAFQLMPTHFAQRLCKVIQDGSSEEDCGANLFSASVKEFLDMNADISVDIYSALILDYFVSGLWWAIIDMKWSEPAKVSSMYTILHTVLLKLKGGSFLQPPESKRDKVLSVEDVEEEPQPDVIGGSLTDCAVEVKKLLVQIAQDSVISDSSNLPAGAFTLEDVSAILRYMNMTVLQHFRLWEFIFSHHRSEEILGTSLHCNNAPLATLPFPAPLPDAVTEELYDKYMSTGKKKTLTSSGSEKQIPTLSTEPSLIVEAPPVAADREGEQEKTMDSLASSVSSGKLTIEELMAQLTPTDVERIVEEVCHDVLENVERETAARLRDSENIWINKINKIHRVAPSSE